MIDSVLLQDSSKIVKKLYILENRTTKCRSVSINEIWHARNSKNPLVNTNVDTYLSLVLLVSYNDRTVFRRKSGIIFQVFKIFDPEFSIYPSFHTTC